MSQVALRRRDQSAGIGLRAVLSALEKPTSPIPIPRAPSQIDDVKASGDSFLLESFTAEDAWELGHLLYARLLPFSSRNPTVISISLANSTQVLFHTVVGSGTAPDNEVWVQRKRNTVLRFGTSTWLLHCKYKGREDVFRERCGMSYGQAEKYAIHGGGVPIRVKGVEGVVAVVVVSGLQQDDDHAVIVEAIKNNWQ